MAKEKTKAEFVAGLRKLADIVEASEDSALSVHHTFYVCAYEKEALLKNLRIFGGFGDKSTSYGGDDIWLTSRTLPLVLAIPRDKVCRKTVTYDCEPMFSPDDEKELDSAMVAASV
jgi:hypothetical protein